MDSAREFGRYRLLEPLSAGGMGIVYRAFVDGPEGFRRAVVVKRILPELSNDETFRRMLAREARLGAMLHHPGIVQVQDFGHVDGEYFLALEFVDGWDLARVLTRCVQLGRLPPIGVVLYIIAELSAALGYAHDARDAEGRALEIVHRDVSPANVMLTTAGGVKLLDFGVARAAEHMRDERTRSGTIKGKVGYFSPEQAEAMAVDRRSDIFALGIVCHEALTGRRLFRGANDLESLRLVRQAEIAPPSRVRRDAGAAVDAVVLRMLARDPAARYQSCHELAAELAPLVHEHHGDATALRRFLDEVAPIPPHEVRAAEPVTVALSGGGEPARARPRYARRVVIGVAIAAAAVAVGFGARALWTSRNAAPAATAPVTAVPPPSTVAPALPPAAPPPVPSAASAAPSPPSTAPSAAPSAPIAAPTTTPVRRTPAAASRSRGPHHAAPKRATKAPPPDRPAESDREVPELKSYPRGR